MRVGTVLVGRVCDKLIECGVLLLLVFTPLVLGGVHPITYTLAETLILLLLFLWLVRCIAFAPPPNQDAGAWPLPAALILALLAFLALCALQLVNLPEAARAWLSPRASFLCVQMTRDLPPEAMQDLTFRTTLSLYPFATKIELGKMVSLVALVFLVAMNFRDRRMIGRALWLVVVMGGIISLLGIAQRLTGTNKIYWFWISEAGGTPFGPYPNRNDFAAYINVVIPIAVALLFAGREAARTWRAPSFLTSVDPRLLARVLSVVSRGPIWISLVLMVTALFLSGSRGGTVGLSVSLVTMTALLMASRQGRRRLWGFVLLVTVLVSFAFVLAGEPLMERFSTLPSERRYRLWVWRDSIKVVRDFPVFGTGLGTFMSIFPAYKANPTSSRIVNHAHNEYIHLLVEMGIAGTAAMVLAVVVVIGVLVRFLRSPEEARASSPRDGPPVQSAISARGGRASGARNPQSTIFWWYVAGILSGWAGVMTHGIFTLCIRIPANAYLLAFSAGIGLACAAALRLPVAPSPRRRVAASLLLSAGLLLVMGLTLPIAWWACAAGYAAQSARLAQESRAPTKQLHELLEAARLDPSYSMAHLELARIYDVLARSPLFAQKEFPEETPSTQELLAKAILRYQEAIATQPTNADFHSALASFLAWAPNLSKMQRIAKTDAAFKRAIYLAPNEDMFWFYLGVFYEGMGERARALACFQGGLNVRTRQLRPIVVMLTEHGASASEIERVLPGQPKCYVDAAELLAGMAKPKEARSILESGRRLLLSAVKGPAAVEEEGEKPPDLALANRIGRIYLAIGENSTAIAWLTQCIAAAEKEEKEGKHEKAQGNTELRRSLVAAFVKSGEWDKAVQEAKRLIDDEPSEAKNYMSMADALIAKGDLPGAEEQYRHALRMTPLDFWLVTSLFNLLKNEGQLNAACEVLDEFLRLGGTRIPRGELAQTYGLRALLFTAAGRYDEALMAYDRALFFEPQNTQFKNGRDAVLKKMALEKSRK